MNGQKETRVVSLPGADSARFGLGLGPVAWRLGPGPQGSLGFLRTLTFTLERLELSGLRLLCACLAMPWRYFVFPLCNDIAQLASC